MRVLILGGDGMLGHQLLLTLGHDHDARVTLRLNAKDYSQYKIFHDGNAIYGVDLRAIDSLQMIMDSFCPDVLINAVGHIKQRDDANAMIPSLEINALLPHRLADICLKKKVRLIHFSTDCVFLGKKGMYREEDIPDARDTYGLTKYLGELTGPDCLTLRTSMVGLELSRKRSLIEWFLSQKGKVTGYTNAIFSGLTTLELSKLVGLIITRHTALSGLYHVAAEPISKYQLLLALAEKLDKEKTRWKVYPDDSFVCNRSLNSERFQKETGYTPPSWDHMLSELAGQIRSRE